MLGEVGSGLVIIVEDPFIGKFLRCVLVKAGYSILEMETEAAREFLRSGDAPVRALVTNQPLAFSEFAHDIHLLYTSSCPELDAIRSFEHSRVLKKPFCAGQLVEAIQELSAPVLI